MPRELALIGGGHAHVEVIRRWGLAPIPDARLTVFDPNPRPVYSGMVPGFVAGQYERHELEIDLKALCDRAGADFVETAVTSVGARELTIRGGASFAFETASMDIGSTVAGVDRPGVREHALASRPIATLISQIEPLFDRPLSDPPLHVVGGGAGGVELAFCLDARLRQTRPAGPRVMLLTSDRVPLESSAPGVRRRVRRALERRGIRTVTHLGVVSVQQRGIELSNGEVMPSGGAVWVTGPASHPLAERSGLPVDRGGFVQIEATLRVKGRPELFAVGDCASLAGMRKAGVYAVRSGPLLDHNLRASLAGQKLREYAPQGDFLSLLNLGDGTAIGGKWGMSFEGRAAMWLKDRIDRSFMRRYHRIPPSR